MHKVETKINVKQFVKYLRKMKTISSDKPGIQDAFAWVTSITPPPHKSSSSSAILGLSGTSLPYNSPEPARFTFGKVIKHHPAKRDKDLECIRHGD